MDIYVVKKGDTLGNIAANFGVSAGLLAAANGIEADETLVVGQTLVVRYPEKLHTVVPGDTVYSVARQYGISVTELFQRNYVLGGQNRLYRDQTLVISYADEPEKTIGVNGYAYPFINMNLLDATLPYMTYLAPFTYGIDSEGHLLPLSDGELLAAAGYYRTATLMHLSSLTEEGRFSNDRSSKVLRDARVRQKLIGDVVETLQKKNFSASTWILNMSFPRSGSSMPTLCERCATRSIRSAILWWWRLRPRRMRCSAAFSTKRTTMPHSARRQTPCC